MIKRNIVRFKFDLPSIKNFVYFLTNDTEYEEAYFIPIKNKVFFVSLCRENYYLTMSNENSKVNTLKVIQNDVNDGKLNFKYVFAVEKSELKQFLKTANSNCEFYFNLTDDGDTINGGCIIWRNKVAAKEAELQFPGKVQLMTSENYNLKIILSVLLYRYFDFKEIDFSKNSLNIELKYYSAIEKCINSYKNHSIHVALSADRANKITNVSIYADDCVNVYFSQIIIAQAIKNDFGVYERNNDVLTYFRKYLNT